MIHLPSYSYSFSQFDKNKHVRAALRETDISHKHAREIALAIKGLSLERARNVLDQVIEKKVAVPYRRYHNEVAHRSNIRDGFFSGRFPKKASKEFLRLLDNLESNAEYKGMDLDRLEIVSCVIHKGTSSSDLLPGLWGDQVPKLIR